MKKVLSLFLALQLSACASIHKSRVAVAQGANDLPLKITAEEIAEYTDEYHTMIDLTFENTSGRWLHVEEAGVDFANKSGVEHNIIVGDDLIAWAESYRIKQQVKDYNDSLGIAAAILGGVIMAAAAGRSGSPAGVAAGASVAIGAATVQDVKSLGRARLDAQTSKLVPEGHLYRTFAVPPKGYARRWVLVNTPNKMIAKKFGLSLKTIELGGGDYVVPLKEDL